MLTELLFQYYFYFYSNNIWHMSFRLSRYLNTLKRFVCLAFMYNNA